MAKGTFKAVAARLQSSVKPVSIVLEGENFSVLLELDDFDVDAIPGNGGFTVTYDNGGLKAEVSFYNEDNTVKIFEDDVFEGRIVYDNGDTAEITV